MSTFWSDIVRDITPYTPGEQPRTPGLIKLNTNENPYPPSPRALAAARAAADDDLRLYPDPNAQVLKDAAARYHDVDPENVFVGNGSDEVLAFAFAALLKHEAPLLFPDLTYSFYPVYCSLFGIAYRELPLDESFCLRIDDYDQPNGGIVIANPNAPTGSALSLAEVERAVQRSPDSVVLVDEAYVDFGAESAATLSKSYPNLLVVQTLSKSRSLAGLRVGLAIGHPTLIEGLRRIKDSFNCYPLDRVAIATAVAALDDREYFESTRQRIIATRDALIVSLRTLGFDVLPSSANFVLARHPQHDARALCDQLRAEGILVRHFTHPRIEEFLRITVGTTEQCEALTSTLSALLGRSVAGERAAKI